MAGGIEDLRIGQAELEQVNSLLTDPNTPLVQELAKLLERFGGVETLNRQAREAREPDRLLEHLQRIDSPYRRDIDWLAEQRDKGSFIGLSEYSAGFLGQGSGWSGLDQTKAVTLEISAMQFFPWLMAEARQALENRELMPGRVIRVRNMAEQERDNGDLAATTLALQIIGASSVEALDTRGTDGSNVHLGGPETITGYFAGIGQPNDYPLKWAEELLYYFTRYGIRQVLNINSGTVLAGYILHKLGLDIEFKISVYVGNDNPYSVLWTLMTARLFARPDGSTCLAGLNLANSVNNETLRLASRIRRSLGLEQAVRLEHHITETWRSIVRQPYNRREELVSLAREVPNISAKHEGGEVEVEQSREHPSDILDYFLSKEDIEAKSLMPSLIRNYLDKHHSLNLTAQALIRGGIGVIPARNLHGPG